MKLVSPFKDARSLHLLLATALLLAVAAPAIAQTSSSDTPYTVTERGPFYRVWQRTVSVTNAPTGQPSQKVESYTELGDGMHYLTPDGLWAESQDLIRLTANGAEAVQGPMKASFNGDITSVGAITVSTSAGELFQSRPIGLFYSDPASGKAARIATVQACQGTLYPPNVLVFSNALDGVSADLMLVWAKNGFEQNLVIKQRPPAPESFGLSSSTARLQLWTAMDNCPTPRQQRSVQLSSGLTDHILTFDGCWFPVGSAFVFGTVPLPTPGAPARVRLLGPSDPRALPVAKSLVTIQSQKVLIEEINLADLAPALSALPQTALHDTSPTTFEFAERGKLLPSPGVRKPQSRQMQVASGPYSPTGVVLDYIQPVSGDTHSYTFNSGTTYVIGSTFTVGPDGATFQQNVCVKNYGGYLMLYGTVTFPSTGLPVVITSKDDNRYGDIVSNSTANPGYIADPAVWLYYEDVQTTIQNVIFRWARTAIKYDENPGVLVSPSIVSASFQNCQYGVCLNIQDDTLSLSQVTSCNVGTPVSISSGSASGSMTPDCGVVSVALVNDPNRDSTGLDPNKNSQSECTFVPLDGSIIVTAFWNTHLSEYGLGAYGFNGISSPRSIGWSRSVNAGASFSDLGPLLPATPNPTQGDAGDPVMAYDPGRGGANGTIYLLCNPSRESSTWLGFRLWTSTDKGQTFSLVNANVPSAAVTSADKPALKVNTTTHDLYMGGRGPGLFAAHSSDAGSTWDSQALDTSGGGPDIAIAPDGTAYIVWLQSSGSEPNCANIIRYAWRMTDDLNWRGPLTFGANLSNHSSTGRGKLLRSKSADPNDFFESNAFPRVIFASGRLYVVYADFAPSTDPKADQGDIFIAEATVNSDRSLNLNGAIRKVNNDGTATDQWNPSIAANSLGTELFVGYYSRQNDVNNNSRIVAYGARARIDNLLANATFDCLPISQSSFPPLFAGTTASTPPASYWLYDPVWPQAGVCLDSFARYGSLFDGINPCPPDPPGWFGNLPRGTEDIYTHFCADDYTWAAGDSSYFYFAWCDRSRPFGSRPDADVQFAKIRQ